MSTQGGYDFVGKWPIEILFQEVKSNFEMGYYQIQTLKKIKWLMLMIPFVSFYFKHMTPNHSGSNNRLS